jgi:hypothetical protein
MRSSSGATPTRASASATRAPSARSSATSSRPGGRWRRISPKNSTRTRTASSRRDSSRAPAANGRLGRAVPALILRPSLQTWGGTIRRHRPGPMGRLPPGQSPPSALSTTHGMVLAMPSRQPGSGTCHSPGAAAAGSRRRRRRFAPPTGQAPGNRPALARPCCSALAPPRTIGRPCPPPLRTPAPVYAALAGTHPAGPSLGPNSPCSNLGYGRRR